MSRRCGWHHRLVPPCDILHVPKNSHFLAISTETGYLFLLTAPALNIKPQVPPYVSCPGRNSRHRAIPLAPKALNEGKASTHKQTPNIPLSVSFLLLWTAELLYSSFSMSGMPQIGGAWICVGQLSWIRNHNQAVSILYGKTITLGETETHWLTMHSRWFLQSSAAMCDMWSMCAQAAGRGRGS